MSALDVFTYTDRQVRTVMIDGEPWFVAADVASILGYRMASDMTRRLDGDEKGTRSVRTPGGDQDLSVISESGLYSAVIGSQVPGAREFKRWITREVLPSIRRTGSYTGQAQLPRSYADALRAAADAWEAKELAEARVALDAPKVEAFETLMEADGSYTMEAAAKALYDLTGLGRNKLYDRPRERGVLMSTNTPYQRYVDQGLFRVVVGSYRDRRGMDVATYTTYVTPKGVEALRRMFTPEVTA